MRMVDGEHPFIVRMHNACKAYCSAKQARLKAVAAADTALADYKESIRRVLRLADASQSQQAKKVAIFHEIDNELEFAELFQKATLKGTLR